MTMSSTLIDQVKRRAADEAERQRATRPGSRCCPGAGRPLRRSRVRRARGRGRLRAQLADGRPRRRAARARRRTAGSTSCASRSCWSAATTARSARSTTRASTAARRSSPRRAGNTGRRLTCPYHNWVYSLEGELVGYPDAEQLLRPRPGLPRAHRDPVRDVGAAASSSTSTRTPCRSPSTSARWPTTSASSATSTGALRLVSAPRRDVPVNWKVPVDANIETYHVNYVHKDTAALGAAPGAHRHPAPRQRPLADAHPPARRASTSARRFPPLFDGVGDLPELGHVLVPRVPEPQHRVRRARASCSSSRTGRPARTRRRYHVHWCSSLAAGRPTSTATSSSGSSTINETRAVRGPDRAARDPDLDRCRRARLRPAELPGAPHLPRARDDRPGHRRRIGSPRRCASRQVLGDHVEA